ncbi:MAG TPA: hypothetical protein VFW28_07580 [Micropepsaceae bacterium]|nr:hypothetical protein [Micropepsaceae bacterium]
MPSREIAVLIPEVVKLHWYQYLLHTEYADHLRKQLPLHGGTRLTVINVPIHFEDGDAERPEINAPAGGESGASHQAASKLRVKSSGSGGPQR